MLRRLFVIILVTVGLVALEYQPAEAAGRRGFFRRARATRATSYRTSNSYRSRTYRTNSSSQKLHMTHSRSAILDGFFGPYPGIQGHDASWYVGR